MKKKARTVSGFISVDYDSTNLRLLAPIRKFYDKYSNV